MLKSSSQLSNLFNSSIIISLFPITIFQHKLQKLVNVLIAAWSSDVHKYIEGSSSSYGVGGGGGYENSVSMAPTVLMISSDFYSAPLVWRLKCCQLQ